MREAQIYIFKIKNTLNNRKNQGCRLSTERGGVGFYQFWEEGGGVKISLATMAYNNRPYHLQQEQKLNPSSIIQRMSLLTDKNRTYGAPIKFT